MRSWGLGSDETGMLTKSSKSSPFLIWIRGSFSSTKPFYGLCYCCEKGLFIPSFLYLYPFFLLNGTQSTLLFLFYHHKEPVRDRSPIWCCLEDDQQRIKHEWTGLGGKSWKTEIKAAFWILVALQNIIYANGNLQGPVSSHHYLTW